MNNLERFTKAINWEATDRILTYDYLDCRQILIDHGGFDATRSYSFEELIEVNGKAWRTSAWMSPDRSTIPSIIGWAARSSTGSGSSA